VVWQPLSASDADPAAVKALLRGDSRAALDDARTAASANPVSADAQWVLSEIEIAVGDRAAARAALVKATSRQPSNAETWQRLGEFDIRYRRPQPAIDELSTALELDLTAVQPLWDLATAYTALHNAGAARHELALATQRQPRNPQTWQQLGEYDLQNGSAQTALPELQSANKLGASQHLEELIAKAQAALSAPPAQAKAASRKAARRRHGR
jgi:tetratricopeptide (TPR) repeat protein